MTEIERIRDQIERAFDGDAWCGPSLLEVLAGVSADQAAARVPGLVHSIWGLVLHLAAWQGVVAQRLAGVPTAFPEMGNWPVVPPASDLAWQATLQTLDESHRAILRALDSWDEAQLDAKIGDSRDPAMGSGMTAYGTLQGVVQHSMYHVGQIAILKKLTDRGDGQ